MAKVWTDVYNSVEPNQLASLAEKTTPVDADLILVEDSTASGAKKKVQIRNLPTGSADLSNAVFPTYAGFDEYVDNTGADPAVDFSTGNKQKATNAAIGAITLSAPTSGTYMLRLPDSGSVTSINGSTGTTTWVGGIPTWAAGKTASIGCDWDAQSSEWTLCGSVEA